MKRFIILLCLFIHFGLFAQLPKGDRTLAWITEPAEGEEFIEAFNYGQDACMESVHHFFKWNDLETDAGEYDAEFIAGNLDVVNLFYPMFDMKVELTIAMTNTVAKETPEDLMDVPFDDPDLINRFKVFMDTVLVHLPDVELAVINIGNESDILFNTDEEQYLAFKVFLDSIIPYTKMRYNELYGKEVNMGVTMTLEGMTSPDRGPLCAILNENTDVISTTYYPLGPAFVMNDPTIVFEDFQHLVDAYDTDQPIYFSECGYASSETCNSNEIKQAQFYSNMFAAWDLHADRIKYMTIFKLTDWSSEFADELGEYYGLDHPAFLEYLRTLGVREYDGTFKLAYDFILCELEARDWCDLECPLTEIAEMEESTILFYPQPAQDVITINLPENQLKEVRIISPTGQVILKSQSTNISLAKIPKGLYLIQIEENNGSLFADKLIIN
jgi:hypothetical protein